MTEGGQIEAELKAGRSEEQARNDVKRRSVFRAVFLLRPSTFNSTGTEVLSKGSKVGTSLHLPVVSPIHASLSESDIIGRGQIRPTVASCCGLGTVVRRLPLGAMGTQ